MCGITGFFNSDGIAGDAANIVTQMLGEMLHRGPDEAGYYTDNFIAMGAVRLSIIDLKTGSQPLSDSTGRFWICYNGELYNYKELRQELEGLGYLFITRSDTEVVLYSYLCWKEKALEKFNGAFSFCVYDALTCSVFAARDRYGKKPFYYSFKKGVFLFASEVKAFKAFPEFGFDFDVSELISMSTIWTPLPTSSCFKDISQLPHGNFIRLEGQSLEIDSWLSESNLKPSLTTDTEHALFEVRGSLEASVRYRMESDAEVGVYLSGGLDSSIIALLASRQSPTKLKTFSIAFEEKEYDESLDQKIIYDFLNVENSQVRISNEKIANNFSEAVYHAEVPVFRTAFVPMFLLSKLASESGVKVVLTGEGADEAFLGYDIFRETMLRLAWKNMSVEERKKQILNLNKFLGHYKEENINLLYAIYDKYSKNSENVLFSHEMRYQNGKYTNRMFSESEPFCSKLLEYIDNSQMSSTHFGVDRAQWLEFETLLAGYLLSTQGDRMCAANGIENRCPFLDFNVVETAKKFNFKYSNSLEEKKLLKMAFGEMLPENIIKKKKFPYRSPDSKALISLNPETIELILSEEGIDKIPFLDKKFCKSLVRKLYSSEAVEISPKEDQAFVFLYSLILLNHHFVENKKQYDSSKYNNIKKILTVKIDRRDPECKNIF